MPYRVNVMKNIRNGLKIGRLFAVTPKNTEKLFIVTSATFLWALVSLVIRPNKYHATVDKINIATITIHVV